MQRGAESRSAHSPGTKVRKPFGVKAESKTAMLLRVGVAPYRCIRAGSPKKVARKSTVEGE